jgi:hypothetical protein
METNRKLEIASFVLTIVALYLLSIPNINTFIVFIVSMIVQMALFYRTKQVFLFIQMLVIFGWNFYSYWQWTIKGIG